MTGYQTGRTEIRRMLSDVLEDALPSNVGSETLNRATEAIMADVMPDVVCLIHDRVRRSYDHYYDDRGDESGEQEDLYMLAEGYRYRDNQVNTVLTLTIQEMY